MPAVTMPTIDEFKRAYDLDSETYHGKQLSDEDRAFVVDVIKRAIESDAPLPLGVSLWIMYACKDYNIE